MRFNGEHLIIQDQDAYAIGLSVNSAFRECETPYLYGFAKMALTPAVQSDIDRLDRIRSREDSLDDAFACFDANRSRSDRVCRVLEFIGKIDDIRFNG